ncbi:MAG: histidine kinase dimerization/phospho-acceptor domain-containing protein [Myxococcota bacterium]
MTTPSLIRRALARQGLLAHEIARIRHDLATPLNVLLGRIRLLQKKGGPELQGDVSAMLRQVDRLNEQIAAMTDRYPPERRQKITLRNVILALERLNEIDIRSELDPAREVVGDVHAIAAVVELCARREEGATVVTIVERAHERRAYVALSITTGADDPERDALAWDSVRGLVRLMGGEVERDDRRTEVRLRAAD